MIKIRKSIILILLLLFITGCQIKYELNFENMSEDIHLEDLKVYPTNEFGLTPSLLFFQGYPYNSTSKNADEYLADSKFSNIDELLNSSVLFSKLGVAKLVKLDGSNISIDLKISDEISYYIDMYGIPEKIDFSLYIPYYVSSHNASTVNNNTYTWIIDDIDNAHIKINFDMSKSYNYVNSSIYIYIIVGLFVIIVGVVIYFIIKHKKNNEI